MDPEAIPNFLAEQRDEAPAEVQYIFLTFEDLWERKLWHQLTETLLQYYSSKESEPKRLPIYKTFVLSFADKINQLSLVSLALRAATQITGQLLLEQRTVIGNADKTS
jgi:26S proteasome regulatory subunit N9